MTKDLQPRNPRTSIEYFTAGIKADLRAADKQAITTQHRRKRDVVLGSDNVGILMVTLSGKTVKYQRRGGIVSGTRDGKRYADEGVYVRDANGNLAQMGRGDLCLPGSAVWAWLQYHMLARSALKRRAHKPKRIGLRGRMQVWAALRADRRKNQRGPQ